MKIPAALQAIPTWGVWRAIVRANAKKPDKVPFRAVDGQPADVRNRADWGPFDRALARFQSRIYSGLGFAFFPEYRLVGIDRDHCRNPQTGVLQPWAMQELAQLPTYTEISPSETGYKQICRGQLPDGKHTKPGSQSEMYDGTPGRERYFAITGRHLAGTPTDIVDLGDALDHAYRRMMAFDLAEAFNRRVDQKTGKSWLRERKEGKQLVRCPWAEAHQHGDDEAALFKKRGRKGGYNFKCLHSHCASRTITDLYAYFGFVEDDETDTRHTVFVGGDLHHKTQELWDVISDINTSEPDPILYIYGDSFARMTHMTLDGKPAIDLLTQDKMKELLASPIRFLEMNAHGFTSAAHPPQAVITNMLATAIPPPLPRLRRLVTAPVFARDGSMLTTVGYHAAARIYCVPDFTLPSVAIVPTDADVKEARRLLEMELLGDFAFVNDADKAHALALLLLFFARDLIDADMPLHLIEKPEVGTGAGKLADCCMIPALGGRQSVITDCNDEDEWRKRIFATLLAAPEAVLLDNVVKITSHHLAALFTTKRFKDRMLGSSRMIDLPVDMPWVATGNNPEIGYDIVRRICAIRLDAKMPDPTTRTGFRHPLPEWAIENRSSLVWAALTLIQHWVAQGQPAWNGHPVASFERWSRVMGGILQAAEIPGFGTNEATFRRARNVRGNAWAALVREWWRIHQGKGVSSRDIWILAQSLELDGDLGLHDSRVRDPRVAFGLALRAQRGRQFHWTDDKQEDIEARIEAPEDAPARTPYCLQRIPDSKVTVTVGDDSFWKVDDGANPYGR
jgi:hypothetical protein